MFYIGWFLFIVFCFWDFVELIYWFFFEEYFFFFCKMFFEMIYWFIVEGCGLDGVNCGSLVFVNFVVGVGVGLVRVVER